MSPIEHYFENLLTMDSDIKGEPNKNALSKEVQEAIEICADYIKHNQFVEPTTKNDLGVREFEEIVVEYPPEELCIYHEYKGKPYFSIKYKEGNDYIIGYGTYKPEVLSQYLKDYFISTTKNDLPNCQHTDAEIAKSFIEDVEAVKDQLPCGEQMDFPSTFDEFAEDYGFKDKDEIYTNGSELIPVFRVKQWIEHISTTKNCESCRYYGSHHEVCNYCYKCSLWTEQDPTTKNDLVVDTDKLIADCEKMSFDFELFGRPTKALLLDAVKNIVKDLPSVTPQEPRWILLLAKNYQMIGIGI